MDAIFVFEPLYRTCFGFESLLNEGSAALLRVSVSFVLSVVRIQVETQLTSKFVLA